MITATNLTAGGATGSATSFTTASISPAANALILMAICFYDSAGDNPTAPTSITGNGLTWVLVNQADYDQAASDYSRIWVYRAMGAAPSSGTIVIDFGALSISRVSWSIDQFEGVDTGGTNGSAAIVQSNSAVAGSDGATTLTVTLAAFGNANNVSYGAFGVQSTSSTTFTVGSGYTLGGSFNTSTSYANIATESKVGDDDPNMSWSATTIYKSGAVGVEIKTSSLSLDACEADADVTTTGWTTTPLYSKVNDVSDATVIQATAV